MNLIRKGVLLPTGQPWRQLLLEEIGFHFRH